MNRSLLFALFLASWQCSGQRPATTAKKPSTRPVLMPITQVLQLPMTTGYVVGQEIPIVQANAQIANDFAKWMLKRKQPHEAGSAEYLRRWYTESSQLLQEINAKAPEPLAGFAYLPGSGIPLSIGEKNGAPVLLVTSLRGKYEYNTARQRESEISAKVAQSIMLPVLKVITRHFGDKPEIEHYGVVVTYGVRNFVSDTETTSSQTLCLVAPAKACARFTALEITDTQLARESDAFLLSGGQLRKVEIPAW